MPDLATALTDRARAEDLRDRTEAMLTDAVGLAMRKYLARLQKAVTARVRAGQLVLTAAGPAPYDPITLGSAIGWWADYVQLYIVDAVAAEWRAVYADATGNIPEAALRQAVEQYLPQVTDRLVRGLVVIGNKVAPSVGEESFNLARIVLARAAALGWTKQETANRLALAFGWETNGPVLREWLDLVNGRIDAILDPLGPPGSPAREAARLNDQLIAELQAERAEIIKQLDAEKAYWQARAELIARTESTSLNGYAADRALAAEGWQYKRWLATRDKRTRDEHRALDGKAVPIGDPFTVARSSGAGEYRLYFPGDPAAPVEMIANCRCTMIGADELEAPADVDTTADVETAVADVAARVEDWANTDRLAEADQTRAAAFDAWLERARVTGGYEGWDMYTGSGYSDMNAVLRDLPHVLTDPERSELAAYFIEEFDAFITTAGISLDADTYVKRAVLASPDFDPVAVFTPGATIREPGYLSTTTNQTLYGDKPGGALWNLNILARKGTPAVYGVKAESEIIFARGTTMRVVRIDEEANQIWLEIVR